MLLCLKDGNALSCLINSYTANTEVVVRQPHMSSGLHKRIRERSSHHINLRLSSELCLLCFYLLDVAIIASIEIIDDSQRINALEATQELKLFIFPSHVLQSDVPVDLLDVDKNSAVVSFSSCDSEVKKIGDIHRDHMMEALNTIY